MEWMLRGDTEVARTESLKAEVTYLAGQWHWMVWPHRSSYASDPLREGWAETREMARANAESALRGPASQ